MLTQSLLGGLAEGVYHSTHNYRVSFTWNLLCMAGGGNAIVSHTHFSSVCHIGVRQKTSRFAHRHGICISATAYWAAQPYGCY